MPEPILKPIKEPWIIPYATLVSGNFMDVWFEIPVALQGEPDFEAGWHIFAIDKDGNVRGGPIYKNGRFSRMGTIQTYQRPDGFFVHGVSVHVYGKNPLQPEMGGQVVGEFVWLILVGEGKQWLVETAEPILFAPWAFKRVIPILPGE